MKENELWRIGQNDELEAIIKGENIVRFIKSQRMRWLGHIEKMQDTAIPKKKCTERGTQQCISACTVQLYLYSPYGPYILYRASVPVQYSYTSTPPMGRTACTEPHCLYKGDLYLLILQYNGISTHTSVKPSKLARSVYVTRKRVAAVSLETSVVTPDVGGLVCSIVELE